MKNNPHISIAVAFTQFSMAFITWPFRVVINAFRLLAIKEECPHCKADWSWEEYTIQNCDTCAYTASQAYANVKDEKRYTSLVKQMNPRSENIGLINHSY